MPPIDISNVFRLLSPFLQENPEIRNQTLTLVQLADHNHQPDAEDRELSGEDIRHYIENAQNEAQALSRDLGVLRAQRLNLLGTVENARQILTGLGVRNGVLAQVETAATTEGPADQLNLAEIERVTRGLEQVVSEAAALNPFTIEGEAQRFVQELSEMERTHPERFFPQSQEAQRTAVNLGALRWLEAPEWEHILNLPPPREDESPDNSNVQERFYRVVSTLVSVAGIDPQNPPAEWNIDFATVERRFNELPEEVRRDYGDPEHLMAELRFVARQVSEEVNRYLGEKILANPNSTVSGLSLQPLLDNPLAAYDPRAEFFIQQAGPDGVLTRLELGQSLQQYYAASDSPPSQEDILDELKLLITANRPETLVVETPNFRREVSRLVLADLQRMLDGFTNRDREISVEGGGMFGWGAPLIDGVSWLVTLGGATTGGNTYSDVMREWVDGGDTRRTTSLARLRDLIERPTSDFQDWLRARGADPQSAAIPEALEFLRETAPHHFALLNGPLFQAQRIWDIRNTGDAERQAQLWQGFAQELRQGYWSGAGSPTASLRLNNLDYSRAILHSLMAESRSPMIRSTANYLYRDSLGWDILDTEGHVVQAGGGEVGLNPALWFRNYSDESASTAIGDGVLLAGSFYGGGFPLRGLQAIGTQVGRRALVQGLGRFVGLRSTQAIEFAEMPMLGQAGRTPSWLSPRIIRAGERVAELGRAAYQGSRLVRWPLRAGAWALGDGLVRYVFASHLYLRLRPAPANFSLDRFIEYRIGLPEQGNIGQNQ